MKVKRITNPNPSKDITLIKLDAGAVLYPIEHSITLPEPTITSLAMIISQLTIP